MTSSSIIELSIKEILWNTRGKSWDYLYLNIPNLGVSWYGFISNIEYTPQKYILGKILFLDNEEISFVCCQFEEPEFKDRVNRPILHTFVIFVDESQLHLLPNNLDEQLYHSLKATYANIYTNSEQYINSESLFDDFIKNSINDAKGNIKIYSSNDKINLDKNNISTIIKSDIKKTTNLVLKDSSIENTDVHFPKEHVKRGYVKQGLIISLFIIVIILMCGLSFVLGCFYSNNDQLLSYLSLCLDKLLLK
jgi:hypothetical protein